MKKIIVALLCLINAVFIAGCGKNSAATGNTGGERTSVIIELSQIDINSLPEISEFWKDPDIRGFASLDSETPDLKALKLISSDDSDTVCLVPGVTLTGFGLVDGRLHIQIKYDDILNTDTHGRVWLKAPDGSRVDCENSVSFWAENHTDSFYEYIFTSLEGSPAGCEVFGEFWAD